MISFDALPTIRALPASIIALLDAAFLILLCFLPVYFWVISPLLRQSEKSKNRLETLVAALDGAGNCILITDSIGNINYVNQAFTTVTGYSAEEIIGKNPRILQSGRQSPAFYTVMWNAILSTGEWRGELWNKRKDGSEYLETLHIKAVSDERGKRPCYIGIISDITDKKRHEELLAHTEKMASIGTLVGGIAHNFNNLLSGIIGNAFLAQDSANPPKTNERLQLIERVSFDASEMIKQLLIFARNHEPEKKHLAISPIIQQAIQTAKLGFTSNTELNVTLPDEDVFIYCNAVEVQQLIINMLNNAHDALPTSGKRSIGIHVYSRAWQACYRKHECDGCRTQMLTICIDDSGKGIDEKDLPYIFEPFYTTKEVGQGTGLGLSTAFSTVQAHGGVIHVRNLEQQGACFEIYLPIAPPETEQEKPILSLKQARKSATLLVIDDESMVRNTLKQLLENLGYHILTAHTGQEAAELVLSEKQQVDLIISDIVMPVMNGISTIKTIRESFPKIPVLFMTGYEKPSHHMLDHYTHYISKPFDMKRLSHEIDTLLHPIPHDYAI